MEEMGTKTSIKVNKETKELLEAKRMDLTGIEHNRIVDLSVDGDRWEGDVLNGEPCGWGVVYDKDNNKVYEGFRVDGVDACYGRSYYPGTSQIEYDGMLCDGKRHGKGVQYDRNGEVVFEGDWVDNYPVDKHVTLLPTVQAQLHSRIEALTIGDESFNKGTWKQLDISIFRQLRTLVIGDNCCKLVETFALVGFKHLTSVRIGYSSFTKNKKKPQYRQRHCFLLKDCPLVTELVIGRHAFEEYTLCIIKELPSLERIEMGAIGKVSNNFYHASLELKRGCYGRRCDGRTALPAVSRDWSPCIQVLQDCRLQGYGSSLFIASRHAIARIHPDGSRCLQLLWE